MENKDRKSNNSLKVIAWLFMALICVVFSSASKKLIELRISPGEVNTQQTTSKKIKDGCRDRRQYLNTIVYADKQDVKDNDLQAFFFFDAFFSVPFKNITGSSTSYISAEQAVANIETIQLYLQHRRIQV